MGFVFFTLFNFIEGVFSGRRWRFNDRQPHAQVLLPEAMNAAGQEVTPEHCRQMDLTCAEVLPLFKQIFLFAFYSLEPHLGERQGHFFLLTSSSSLYKYSKAFTFHYS